MPFHITAQKLSLFLLNYNQKLAQAQGERDDKQFAN